MDPFKGGDGKGFNPLSMVTELGAKLGTGGIQTQLKEAVAPLGKRPKARQPTATFLGSDATVGPASSNFGGKTLMGM